MIPTIETIIEDLLAGKISKSLAITWLHAHSEGAVNEQRRLYVGLIMSGMAGWRSFQEVESINEAVSQAFDVANAMLKHEEQL